MPTFQVDPALGPQGVPLVAAVFSWREQSCTVPAVIDSGSVSSFLPIEHILRLGLRQIGLRWVRGITGPRERQGVFAAHVRLGEFQWRYHPVVSGGVMPIAILGQDILRKLVVRLDGPARSFDLST